MASSDSPAIETTALGFSYGDREVLCDVDLRCAPGEIVGVLGPNGSGKSTLVRVLSGVLAPYRGSARVAGAEVRDVARRELARQVAVVPQEPTFGFPFSALETVLMGRHPHLGGLAFESERDVELAREALERCGALALADRPIHELSAGERQRIVFARALCQQPDVLLLDEPSSFLDVRHQVELHDLVRDLAERRRTAVLTVMHDLSLAAEYCDRVYLLRAGRVAASGTTAAAMTYVNLKHVFDTDVYVDTNALTGALIVTPLPGRVQARLRERRRAEPADPSAPPAGDGYDDSGRNE